MRRFQLTSNLRSNVAANAGKREALPQQLSAASLRFMRIFIVALALCISSISFGATLICPATVEGLPFTSFGLYDQHPVNNFELVPDDAYEPLPLTWTQLTGLELWLECDYGAYILQTDRWGARYIRKIGVGHSTCKMLESQIATRVFDGIDCH